MSGSRNRSAAGDIIIAKTARREVRDPDQEGAAFERTLAGSRRLGAQSPTTTRGNLTIGDQGLVTLQPRIALVAVATLRRAMMPATPSPSAEPAAVATGDQHQLVVVAEVSRVNLLGQQLMLLQVFLFLAPQDPRLQRQLK